MLRPMYRIPAAMLVCPARRSTLIATLISMTTSLTAQPARHSLRYRLDAMADGATVIKWICQSCGYIYDPDEGDPDGGIPPGTQFADIPDTWYCPVCGARKKDFAPYTD